MKRTRLKIALGVAVIVLLIPLLLPEQARIPVQGATARDWNKKSFWYEPWGESGVHKGIDIFAPAGRPVVAAVPGVVIFRGPLGIGGNVVAVLGPKWRMLVLVAVLLLPVTAFHEVLTGFRQIAAGAIAPISTAQRYIQATNALALEAGFLSMLGLVAAKMAAFNLLPFPWTNGGQALLAMLRVDRTTDPAWQARLNSPFMLVFTALLLSWAVALCVFVVRVR